MRNQLSLFIVALPARVHKEHGDDLQLQIQLLSQLFELCGVRIRELGKVRFKSGSLSKGEHSSGSFRFDGRFR